MKKIIRQRARFYVAVEGEGEQSFIKWLQNLSDQSELHIHLDCQLIGGGGYRTMLSQAVKYRKRKERNKVASSVLLLDADRAEKDDGWSLDQLRKESTKKNFNLCLQFPNQEGLFLRMLPRKENLKLEGINVNKLLQREWPEYQKPIDAYTLNSKFTLSDLFRMANSDIEIKNLLSLIGLLH